MRDLFTGAASASATNDVEVIAEHSSDRPINEIQNNRSLLAGAFPMVIPLGFVSNKEGSLAPRVVSHLLRQFHLTAAHDLRLVLLLGNQLARHGAMHEVSARVDASSAAILAFQQLVASPEYRERVTQAATELPTDVPPAARRARAAERQARLAQWVPILRLAGAKVPLNPLQRNASVSQCYDLLHVFGSPSVFATYSVDDVFQQQAICLSLSIPRNDVFPAVEGGLMDALHAQATVLHEVTMSHTDLLRRLAGNPVAAALAYQRVKETVLSLLVGISPSRSVRKTTPLQTRKRGVLGQPVAYFQRDEEQARSSLHGHCLVWGGVTPDVISAAAALEQVRIELLATIDSYVTSQLSPMEHAGTLLDRRVGVKQLRSCLLPLPEEVEWPEAVLSRNRAILLRTNMHEHTHTCESGAVGAFCCRMAMARAASLLTRIIQLEAVYKDAPDGTSGSVGTSAGGGSGVGSGGTGTGGASAAGADGSAGAGAGGERHAKKPRQQLVVTEREALQDEEPPDRPIYTQPVPPGDGRMLVVETARPDITSGDLLRSAAAAGVEQELLHGSAAEIDEQLRAALGPLPVGAELMDHDARMSVFIAALRTAFERGEPPAPAVAQVLHKLLRRNGYTVETSLAFAGALGSNTNVALLGTTVAARNTTMYIVEYICKHGAQLAESLSILRHALDHVSAHPSTAEDFGTPNRTLKHVLSRCVNSFGGNAEVGANMVAHTLLGGEEFSCSDPFVFSHPYAAVTHAVEVNARLRDTGRAVGRLADLSDSQESADWEEEGRGGGGRAAAEGRRAATTLTCSTWVP